MGFWETIVDKLTTALVKDDRYKQILHGFENTILISICAVFIGIAIGILVAVCRVSSKNNVFMKILDKICGGYVTIIRGTPVMVQLLIAWNLIFVSRSANAFLVATLTFGINSGAYVSEIIRAGILSIDKGQTEAGRSLGLTGSMTMRLIVLPQAIKNILPALGNEFIILIKETSVAGIITVTDLTKAAQYIGSRTYDYLVPLLVVTAIYLILVLGLTKLLRLVERRFRQSD